MKLLAIAYPELTDKDHNLIEGFRKLNDKTYRLIRPHFTIVFPVSDISITEFTDEIKSPLQNINSFQFCLRSSVVNKDAFSDQYHAFLVPDEGNSQFIKLHDNLYGGKLFKYQQLDLDFIPHIGIGNSTNKLECKKMVDEWNSKSFAINGIISSIDIIKYENENVEIVEKIKLNIMNDTPIVIERTYNTPIAKLWQAITDKGEMKQWYFDLAEFKPEVGFEFRFTGGTDERKYLHLCKITEALTGKKITYSWRFDGYEGISFVTFELFPDGDKTKLVLTHKGLESFPKSVPDFAKENFVKGWTSILDLSLNKFLEKNQA